MLNKTYTLFFLLLLLTCNIVVNADEDYKTLYTDSEGKTFYEVDNNFTMTYQVEYIIDSSSIYNIIDIPLPLIKGGASFNESTPSLDYYNDNLSISILPNMPIGLNENYDIDRYIQFNTTSYFLTVGNLQVVEGTVLTIYLLFTPQQEENITYFVEKMDTVTVNHLPNEETIDLIDDGIPFYILLIPFALAVTYALVHIIYNYLDDRRTMRERRRRLSRSESTVNSMMDTELRRLRELQRTVQQPRPIHPPKTHSSKEVFKCKTTDLREFVGGEGLFQKGIKKFDVLPYEKQVERIKELPEVVEYQSNDKSVLVELGRYGKYYYTILPTPKVYRVEKDGYISHRNPYIGSGHRLCLGDALHTYNRCYLSKNYLECVRIVNEVLKSRHGHGFRSWSECGL